MFLLVIALFFLDGIFGDPILVDGSRCEEGRHLSKRVVGGYPIEIQNFPWIVSIQMHKSLICGGSILSETIILTAAHCMLSFPPDSLTIRVGSSRFNAEGSKHKVVGFEMHENYTHSVMLWNDVALIKVTPPIEFSETVTNVCLPEAGSVLAPGTEVTVAGWGRTTASGRYPKLPKTLIHTSLRIVDNTECSKAYFKDTGTSMSSNGLICAAAPGTDTCTGDSGGPLMDGCVQLGVISAGKDCANLQFPGVYSDVAYHLDWIQKNSAKLDLVP